MHRALRLLFVGSFALTAACGTILALDDGEDPSPLPSGADAEPGSDGAPVTSSGADADLGDADGETTSKDGGPPGVRDSGRDADAAPDAGADAATAPDADVVPPGRFCAGCRTARCTKAPGICDPLVFITSTALHGDLQPASTPSASGVATGPDRVCDAEAKASGLTARFRAWAGGKESADTHPMDRIQKYDDVPYRRTDATIVVARFADFDSGQQRLLAPINLTLDRSFVPDATKVWTGLTRVGTVASADCLNWTSGTSPDIAATGTFGVVQPCTSPTDLNCNGKWTSLATANCTELHRLYCIQSNE